MSTVLCLGGAGQFGLAAASMLVGHHGVERLVIAGRSAARCEAAAAELGEKAVPYAADVDDADALREAMLGVDLVVTTLPRGPGRQERVIRAAVAAGAHVFDLNGELPPAALDAVARRAGVLVVTHVGSNPGVLDLAARRAREGLDHVVGVTTVVQVPQLLDAWDDLFERYVRLPDGGGRGPDGRRLFSALTAPDHDLGVVARIVRDARLAAFGAAMVRSAKNAASPVPDVHQGAIVDVDAVESGVSVPDRHGGLRSLRPLVVIDRPAEPGQPPRRTAYVTGMAPAFDEAVRQAAAEAADGAALAQACAAIDSAVSRDPARFLVPSENVLAIPTMSCIAIGTRRGHAARSSVHFETFVLDRRNWLAFTAAAMGVIVSFHLDGELRGNGVTTMRDAVEDLERFEGAYLRALPVAPAGARLFHHRHTA